MQAWILPPCRPGAAPPPGEAGAIQPGIVAMAGRCVADLPTQGRSLGALRAEARGVLATLVVSMFGSQALLAGGSISQQLAAAWKRPRAEPAIRQALCLLADHELNASTFATRVTISTGASLSAGILSGLATLTGPLHGRAAMSLKPLIDAMAHADAESLVRERLHMGLGFPAFGHPVSRRRSARRRAAGKPGPAKRLCRPGPAGRAPGGRAAEHRFRTGGAERRAPSALACPAGALRHRTLRGLARPCAGAGRVRADDPAARALRRRFACRAARRIGDPERRQAAPERRGLTAPAGWQSRDATPTRYTWTLLQQPQPHLMNTRVLTGITTSGTPISATTPARSARPSSPAPSPAWTRSSSWPTITR